MTKNIAKTDEFGLIYFETDIINPKNKRSVIKVKSVIDTGASKSHIQPELIKVLELDSKSNTSFTNPIDGLINSGTYELEVILNGIKIKPVNASIIHDETFPAGLIIGLDIIKRFNFSFQAKTKIFELTLPKD